MLIQDWCTGTGSWAWGQHWRWCNLASPPPLTRTSPLGWRNWDRAPLPPTWLCCCGRDFETSVGIFSLNLGLFQAIWMEWRGTCRNRRMRRSKWRHLPECRWTRTVWIPRNPSSCCNQRSRIRTSIRRSSRRCWSDNHAKIQSHYHCIKTRGPFFFKNSIINFFVIILIILKINSHSGWVP